MGKGELYLAIEDLRNPISTLCLVCKDLQLHGSTLCPKHANEWQKIAKDKEVGWGASVPGWNAFGKWILTHPNSHPDYPTMPIAETVHLLCECPICEKTRKLYENDYICEECRYG